jgi:hypothetical protein
MRMRLGPRKSLIASDYQLQTDSVKGLYSGLARRLQYQCAAAPRGLSIRSPLTSTLDRAGIPCRGIDAVGICAEAGTLQAREPSFSQVLFPMFEGEIRYEALILTCSPEEGLSLSVRRRRGG